MADFVKINLFAESLANALVNFGTHSFKVMLTNTAPVAASAKYKSALTDIAAGNGYTAGGAATTISLSNSAGTESVAGTDVTFTATGAVGPFRYAVLYDGTPSTDATKPLVGFWDYGSSISLAAGETFTVDFGTSILTIA